MTEAAALEGAHDGIRVNTISPGPVATEMSKRPGETDSDRASHAGATVALARQWLGYEADKPALPESAWATDESMNVPGMKR